MFLCIFFFVIMYDIFWEIYLEVEFLRVQISLIFVKLVCLTKLVCLFIHLKAVDKNPTVPTFDFLEFRAPSPVLRVYFRVYA